MPMALKAYCNMLHHMLPSPFSSYMAGLNASSHLSSTLLVDVIYMSIGKKLPSDLASSVVASERGDFWA